LVKKSIAPEFLDEPLEVIRVMFEFGNLFLILLIAGKEQIISPILPIL
jgi:hypothetical protein